MAAAEVREVLEFLRRNGFDLAAAALRDDVEEEGVLLPPVRTGVVGDRADGDGYGGAGSFSSTSSSSDAFVSMGSSPTDLTNPYGLWPAGNAEPSESSDTNSEFGTAREYNDSNIFSDVNWFDEKYGGYSKDPYLVPTNYDSAPSEDKFSMALESEEIFGKKSDPHFIVEMDVGGLDRPPGKLHKDCEECTKICGQTVPHYDVYGDTKEFHSLSVDQVEDPMSSNYRNHAAGNQEERPGTAREVSFQLVEDSPEADYWEGALSDHLHYEPKLGKQIKNLDSQLFEKELHMLSTNGSAQKGDKSVSVGDLLTHSLDKSNAAKLFKKVEAQQLEKELHMLSLQSLVQSSRTNEKERQTIDCQMDNGVEADMDDNKLQGDYDFPFVTEEPSWEGVNDIFHYKDHGSIIVDTKDHGLVSDGKDDNHTTDEIQLHYSPEEEYEIFELRIVHRKNRTGFEESKELPIVLNSVTAGRYYITEYLGSAAFSKVVQAHDLQTGVDVCLKIIKNDKDFFDQSLDEIKLLKYVNKHDPADENHILRLYDYFYHQEHLFIVCELLKANLYEFQKYNQESGGELYFTLPRIQSIARQCLEALEYLHRLGIIHCDLKPENILIKSYSRCEIKIIDLGSSCFYTDKLSFYVQSRSYRAPEVILGLPYDNKIDIWSLGCILVELLTGDVLFPNDSVEILLARMIGVLGPIDVEMLDLGQETHKYFTNDYDLYHKDEESGQIEYIIPQSLSLAHLLGYPDPAFVNFLLYLLQTNPRRRPSVIEALQHPWLSYQYQ